MNTDSVHRKQRRPMRYVIAILGVLAVVGGLTFVKASQIKMLIGMGEQMKEAGPPPDAVASALAKSQSWEGSLRAVGTVASTKGVTVSVEVPGTVAKINFESGASVKRGDVLLQLDTSIESAQLSAALVRRELAAKTVSRTLALTVTGVTSKAQLDTDQSQLESANAEIAVLQAQLSKKTVRAPFDGRLGIRSVNVGQYLNPGTPIATLEAVEGVYVDFTLPQQESVALGMRVRIQIEGMTEIHAEGTVVAIEPTVDATSRTQKLRAKLANQNEVLQPGMFAKVSLLLPKREEVVIVPATAIVYAPYGDSIFILEAAEGNDAEAKGPAGEEVKIARQQFVRIGERRGDFVSITDGVKAGDEVVIAGAFKLRNKGRVFINNELAPKVELSPTPVNH